uniref:Centromere protein J n=1 Tax=Seriola dumerili TaxID=41447 RepID=A0A3B4UJ67_SERDU
VMSSPAGLQYSQAEFLARWMPSSSRAGVILNPSPDLAGSLRHMSTVGSPPLEPDDSFASDFAPLSASADSSCVGVDGFLRPAGGERAGTDRPVNVPDSVPIRNSDGHLDSLDEMASKSQDLPLMMKLEEVRISFCFVFTIFICLFVDKLIFLPCVCPLARPIKPGIGGHKQTFEELLEEQLRLEEQRLNQDGAEAVHAPPKRAFLKRGEGLSRFTNNRKASLPKKEMKKDSKPQPRARVISRSNSEPAAILKGGTNCIQRLPVQRKTAILNKENRLRGLNSPPQDTRAESKMARMKVLGSHQRQNTEGSESIETDSEGRRTKQTGSEGDGGGEGEGLGEFELLEQAAEELSFSSNSSFGLHQRRLSSTPIKSPPRGALQRCSSGGLTCKNSSVNAEAFVAKRRDDAMKNKVNIEDEEGQDSGREDKHSDVSSCGSSEFEDQEVAVKAPVFPCTFTFPAQSNPPYDKRSYQDEDSCRDSDVTQDGDGESDGVLSNADESTLIEDKVGQQRRVVFDDDDTWNDLEETTATANRVSPPERPLLRKVAVSKVVELDKGTVTGSANLEPDPPPASQLMTRLFPSLKPKAQNTPLPPPTASVGPEPKKPEEETGQQVQSRQLRERLVELEIEIERFKKENAALAKLRQENERNQENLRKERLEFEQTKAEELAKFEEYKKEENKKLQKERKLFEKHASAARAIPDKKEREEIQALKQQLNSLQEELRRKENRWTSTHSRLRQQMDSLSQENSSLQDEIRVLEKLRLSTWKKNPVTAEKDKETKDAPGFFVNNVSSVTKGVKFAVSMFILSVIGWFVYGKDYIFSIVEKVLAGGDRLIVFPNGTRKEVSADGLTVKVTFFNGDTKQVTADQRVIYYYSDAQTTHITYPDGMEVLHFPNNQTEKHFPDGRKEITFPDQTVKNLFPNGREESVLTDGTIIQVNPDGTKEIHFNTGQKEIHTADYKKREYPDGTVKTVYADGRQETRYPTGRLRIKDKDGNVVLDHRA